MIYEAYIQSVEVKTEVKLGYKQIIPLKKTHWIQDVRTRSAKMLTHFQILASYL